ncbi:hypothetical protein FQZ97_961060 [compost metagenome]
MIERSERHRLLRLLQAAALGESFGCLEERAIRHSGEARTQADAPDAQLGQFVQRQPQGRGADQYVDRPWLHRLDHFGDFLAGGQARRVEHIGAGLGERHQALDGVVQILAAMEEILRPCRQGEGEWQRTRRLHRRANPLDGLIQRIDRLVHAAAGILDGAADQADGRRHADGFGAAFGLVAVAVLQIRRH